MKRSDRMVKVDALIASELSNILLRDVEFPQGSVVSILHVQTSRDLMHAKIVLSILPEQFTKEVLALLEEERRNLEAALHKRLVMKFTPRLHFRVDDSLARQEYMEKVLDSIPHEE